MGYSKLYKPLCLICAVLVLSACTTSSPRNRGSLSDAMDKSRDDYEKEREVPDDPDPWWGDEDEEEQEEQAPRNENQQDGNTSPGTFTSLMILARGGYEFSGKPFFDEGYDGELLLGTRISPKVEAYLYAGFNVQKTDPSHKVSESIKGDVVNLGAGIEGRFYPLPNLTYFSPYLLGRVGGFLMLWKFQNPLIAGGETIESDILGGVMAGVGAGVDLIRSEDFKLGIVIIPEISVYGDETEEGFTNDVFNSQRITRICAEAGFSF